MASGVGKSTAAAALADWLATQAAVVDYFPESDILSRPAFSEVAAQFREPGKLWTGTRLGFAGMEQMDG